MNTSLYRTSDEDLSDRWYDAAEQRAERIAERVSELVALYLRGDRKFWNYMHEDIYESVRTAFTAIGLAPAERWALVERAVWKEIHAEAQVIAEDEIA